MSQPGARRPQLPANVQPMLCRGSPIPPVTTCITCVALVVEQLPTGICPCGNLKHHQCLWVCRTLRPTRSAVLSAATSCDAVICCSWRLRCASAALGTNCRSGACDMSWPPPSAGPVNVSNPDTLLDCRDPQSCHIKSSSWQGGSFVRLKHLRQEDSHSRLPFRGGSTHACSWQYACGQTTAEGVGPHL